MADVTPNSAVQTDYRFLVKPPKPGAAWRTGVEDTFILNAVNVTPDVQHVVTATAVNNDGDISGLYIDGALYEITSGASTATDVASMQARINGAVQQGSLPAGTVVVVTDPAIEIRFGDFGPHEVLPFSPLTADWDPIVVNTLGSAKKNMTPGTWAAFNTTGEARPDFTPVVCPVDDAAIYAGLVRDTDRFPRHSDPDNSYGLTDPEAIPSGRLFALWRTGIPLALLAAGVIITPYSDPVYRVFSGPDAGKWSNTSGATNEIQTLTFTGAAAGTVAGDFDGLPAISFPDTGVDDDNATTFAAALQGNAAYANFTIIDVTANVITIESSDGLAHTFTDASAGGATIATAVTQIPVAANAVLHGKGQWLTGNLGETSELCAGLDLR